MARQSFFVRRARNLMRRPQYRSSRVAEPVRTKLDALVLEAREMPAVSGAVFQDFNASGTFDQSGTIPNLGGTTVGTPVQIGTISTAIDVGIPNVTVTIFDAAGAKVDQVTSKSDGTWSSALTASGQQYRIEFTGVPLNGFQYGPHGASSGTATQFVFDGATGVNLSLVRELDYYRQNPLVVTSEYYFGAANGLAANLPGILSFPYASGSFQQTDNTIANNQQPNAHAIAIPTSQVGTTWGLGYNRDQKVGYAGAFTKRHSGMGPGGPGAIYNFALPAADNPTTVTTATQWANLQGATALDIATNTTFTVDTLGGFGGFFAARNGAGYDYDRDSDDTGWNAVGKSSLGGLDVSDDGSTVYVMNLADNRLYIIPVLANGAADTANIRAIRVPTPAGVAAGDVRAWAVEYHNGQVYVGLVDSAESDQDRTTLRGYVYAFNPATNAFGVSLVNDAGGDGFDLSYNRQSSFAGGDSYLAWSPTYNRVLEQDAGGLKSSQYPQPMLTGLAFDRQGNLSLSIRDRNGDQTGRGTLSNGDAAGPALLAGSMLGRVEGVASGELLKAFVNGATFAMESNGSNPNAPGQTGTGAGSGAGPGGGEFYGEDDFALNGHRGTSLGGIAQIPGYNSIVNTHFDPLINGALRTGGVRWFNASSASLEKAYEIYSTDAGATATNDPTGTFGKANGLGDLVAIESLDPPIEIGNRVFRDTDRDGVQDPGEPAIPNVIVLLQDINGNTLATAKTDANGLYYFNSGPGTKTASEIYNVAGLTTGQKYQVVIQNVSGTQQAALTGLVLTGANATHTGDKTTVDGNGGLRNSDFVQAGTSAVAIVDLTANPVGNSFHATDAGFVDGVSLGNFVWEDANNDGLFNGAEAGIDGITVNLYKAADPNTIISTQKTASGGAYLFNGLLPDDYFVEIVSPAGFRSSSGGGADLVNGAFESGLAAGNSANNNEDHGKAISGNNLTGYTIRANTVTLTAAGNLDNAGAANLRQDFGLVRTFSLGNRVWLDKNNSGTIDIADGATPGIDGATVKLYRPADFDAAGALLAGKTAFRTTTTANGGYYRFDDLLGAVSAVDLTAGSYVVVVDGASASLAGTISSSGTNGSASGPFEPAANVIGAPTTTDSDDSGTTIGGNLIRSGVTVVGPAATLPTGEPDLVGLANPQGTEDASANMTVDFGFYRPLALGNFVWEDKNNNGTFDAGENPIDGVSVQLIDGAGKNVGGMLTTAGGGLYQFNNLIPGSYTVRVTTPTGFLSSTGTVGSKTGAFEPAPQTNTNNVDHGTINPMTAGKFVEAVVTLGDPGTAGNPDTIVSANDANLRQDFGFFQPLAIGDFIFEDRDNNGLFDGTDVPVSGVLVELLDGTNTVVGTPQTTAADGKYRFDNLIAGNYTVRITPPAGLGYISSTGANGKATGPNEPATGITANNADHGTTNGNVITTTLTLLPAGNPDEGGTANLAQDFGLFRPVLLGNLVWADTNNNGVFDPIGGEAGIGGVAVDLLDSLGNVLASTTTDVNGLYQFPVAPGQYRVRITPPAGRASSTGAGPGNSTSGPYEPSTGKTADSEDKGTTAATFIQTELITIADPGTVGNPDNAGFANLRQDFGLFNPIALALGNFVFEDANNNGTFDTGEAPIGGAVVTLFDSLGNAVGTVTTPADGSYRFDNLPPGTYTVQVVAPAGYRNSDGAGTANNTDHGIIDPTQPNKATTSVTLTDPAVSPNPDEAGKANLAQDFGFWRPQAIGNFVFIDVNNNGTKDAGELGKAGVAVTLLQGTTTVGTTTTDANGNYLFSNLMPGTYTVSIAPPAGFISSTGKNGSPTGPFEPGLADNTNDADHGTVAAAAITSTVTLQSPASGNNPDGVDNLRQDFGLFQPISFGNTVFIDSNKNGTLDAGEKMVAGALVRLLDSKGVEIASATTGTDGKYNFTNLAPGNYTVDLTPPTGFTLTPVTTDPTQNKGNQNVGTQVGNSIQANVTLAVGGAPLIEGNTDGNAYLNGDFGLVAPPSAKVSGFVYRDPNLDSKYVRGTSPTGDSPIGAVTVAIFDSNNVQVGTTKTDGNGFYQFTNLLPGTYTIRETQPAGLLDAFDTPGTLGGSSPSNDVLQVTLVADDDGMNYNFGEYSPTQVSGYVWVDTNFNRGYDFGLEPVVSNVPITISGTAFAGTPLERPLTAADVPGGLTTLTNVAGYYSFPVLPPGIYSVSRGAIPPGQTFIDWTEQNNDPTNPVPVITNNLFSSVSTIPGTIRGELNFGLVLPTPDGEPSKTDFLGSSGNTPLVPGTIPAPGGPTRPDVPLSPLFNASNAAATSAYTVVATGVGLAPQVRVFDYATGGEKFRLTPYESSFVGGVRVAQGDVNGDGVDDIVTTTGIGGGPRTIVFDGATGNVIRNFFAFEDTFRGGTWVAVGDVDGDGFGDVIVGAEVGGGPRITTFSGADGSVLNNFFAFDANQRGGTRVAAGDFNGDGKADIVATTGFGVPTRVRVFDGTNVANILQDFAPYEAGFTGGVNIAVGDFNGDNTPDIAVGAEITGGPRAQIFSGKDRSVLLNTFAFESTFTGGVRVAATDANGDGRDELVVTPGPGGSARVRVIDVATLQDRDAYYAFTPEFVGGAYVG